MPNSELTPILILLVAGILGIGLTHRLRLSPIIGYFLAGILIGPHALNWIPEDGALHGIAELGVAFLLFDIGIHLSFNRLWESRREFFALGPSQILLSALAVGLITFALGWSLNAAFMVGAGLALSSTAVVLQTLREHQLEGSPLGRSAAAILIAQDLFVIFLLILTPALTAQTSTPLPVALGLALAKVASAFLLVALVGRYLLHPIFEWITRTKNDEMFTASALLFVLVTAWGTSQLGLSLPLGAFLAGLALSESDFCYLVKSEIYPFRGLLLGLFFMTIGMSLNIPLIASQAGMVLLAVLGLIVVKTLVLFGVSKVMKQCSGFGIRLGLTLSQGSEFSFVLFTLAAAQHIIPRESADFLMAMVGITLTVTPFLVKLGNRLAYAWERESSRNNLNEAGLKKLVYIKGFDATGQEIARILTSAGVDYLGYDDDKERIAMNRSLGFQVDVSDIHRPRLLSALTTAQAQAVILLIDDADAAVTILTAIQELKLSIPVYAATNDVSLYDAMQGFDLNAILVKDNETAYTIAQRLLQNLSYPDDEIETHIETIRQRKLAIR